MSLLNINLNFVAYADEPSSINPLVKFADLSWSLQGLPTNTPKEVPISVAPGEVKTIMTVARTLSFTGGTSFEIVQVSGTTNAQLKGDFGARTARADGDGTTEWTLVKTNKLVRMTNTAGTAPTFAGMVAGDGITVSTTFNILNQGDFVIVNVGADFVEFVNEIATDEVVTAQVEIYSSGAVQVGDKLDLTSTVFAFPNRGIFEITRVTDALVEFSNTDAVPESGVTGVAGSDLIIYPEAFKWLLMAVDGKIIVRLNQGTDSTVVVEPTDDTKDIVKSPGLFLKHGKVFELEIENPGLELVSGVALLTE